MDKITQFTQEYQERKKKSFDYQKIKELIESCKPTFWGKSVDISLLWVPEIFFIYHGGWSAGRPNKDFFDGRNYNKIDLGKSAKLYVHFYAEKKLFKPNVYFGRVDFLYFHDKLNTEEEKNQEEMIKFIKSKYNAETPAQFNDSAQPYFKFTTYEELETFLKEFEFIINKYNTNYHKNNSTYVYFDKDEAIQNSIYKKKEYEILMCDKEIVKLGNQLKEVNNVVSASDCDLTILINDVKSKLQFFENKKNMIINS